MFVVWFLTQGSCVWFHLHAYQQCWWVSLCISSYCPIRKASRTRMTTCMAGRFLLLKRAQICVSTSSGPAFSIFRCWPAQLGWLIYFFLTFTNLIRKESTTLICKYLFSNSYQVTFAFHLHLVGLFLMTRKNLISFLIFLDKPHSSKLETSKWACGTFCTRSVLPEGPKCPWSAISFLPVCVRSVIRSLRPREAFPPVSSFPSFMACRKEGLGIGSYLIEDSGSSLGAEPESKDF